MATPDGVSAKVRAPLPLAAGRGTLLRVGGVGLLVVGYAVLAHLTATRPGHRTLGALLAIGPISVFALLLAWRSLRAAGLALWLCAAALVVAYWGRLQANFVWVYLLQQLGLYGLLGLAFGRTLTRAQLPLCTQMALRVHGTLKPDALRYTRRVTLAWTVLFALIAAALVSLFFAAPLTAWSAFSNFGAPLAIIAMFAAEHLVRYRALPDMAHSGLIQTLRASAAVGFGSARASPLSAEQLLNNLARSAAGCYRPSGLWAYFFARCKLKFDPFYSVLLAEGLIPPGMRILDLGCAQGLIAAWLMAAQRMHAAGVWDRASPQPVAISGYRGVDRNAAEIRRAQLALGARAEFAVGDFAQAPLSDATLVLLIDVLHYLDFDTQVALLRRIRSTLPAHGLVLLRVGDSDGSARARVSVWVDWLVVRLRGGQSALSRRPIAAWITLLNEVGYTVQEVARQSALGYINCLLCARPALSA
jgi:uncharacterized membrane protein/SAM-dependent methyltransferase